MIGITGYFAFAFVLASSILSYSISEANSYSSSNVHLNTIDSSSSSDNNIYSSSPSLSDEEEEVARRKTLAENILLLLGTEDQAARVNAATAEMIRSCFKYFVTPTSSNNVSGEFIWSAPPLIKDLAREAANYTGNPRNFIHSLVNPEKQNIPDANGTWADGRKIPHCTLTQLDYGYSFRREDYTSYFIRLFQFIAEQAPASVGSTVKLDRYDLFHGHMFLAPETRRIGIIFHAQEYPKLNRRSFNVELGVCQRDGNTMEYNQTNMNLRNILWLAPLFDDTGEVELAPGFLVALDARARGIIYEDLVINDTLQYQKKGMSITNADFGSDVGDLNYLNAKTNPNDVDDYKFYVCQRRPIRCSPSVTSE
ncbi:hypothetical protein MKW98_006065 [Papaver atlanticum]|uniref:Uncharacterized protein n=1 Tax=Papaver atlanticum TaxID=357466 RepID=A0AAD4TGQ3_9MAGN|nr:hypothetical protein MKW98_006065 [Papaver atlanticum]